MAFDPHLSYEELGIRPPLDLNEVAAASHNASALYDSILETATRGAQEYSGHALSMAGRSLRLELGRQKPGKESDVTFHDKEMLLQMDHVFVRKLGGVMVTELRRYTFDRQLPRATYASESTPENGSLESRRVKLLNGVLLTEKMIGKPELDAAQDLLLSLSVKTKAWHHRLRVPQPRKSEH